jgi:hypothetical protein
MELSSSTGPGQTGGPIYLTKHQLVARSGLSASTVQRYKDAGKIPFFQPGGPGGKLLFPPDAIEAARRQSLTEQIALPADTTSASAEHARRTAGETQGRHELRGRRPRWQTRLTGAKKE